MHARSRGLVFPTSSERFLNDCDGNVPGSRASNAGSKSTKIHRCETNDGVSQRAQLRPRGIQSSTVLITYLAIIVVPRAFRGLYWHASPSCIDHLFDKASARKKQQQRRLLANCGPKLFCEVPVGEGKQADVAFPIGTCTLIAIVMWALSFSLENSWHARLGILRGIGIGNSETRAYLIPFDASQMDGGKAPQQKRGAGLTIDDGEGRAIRLRRLERLTLH